MASTDISSVSTVARIVWIASSTDRSNDGAGAPLSRASLPPGSIRLAPAAHEVRFHQIRAAVPPTMGRRHTPGGTSSFGMLLLHVGAVYQCDDRIEGRLLCDNCPDVEPHGHQLLGISYIGWNEQRTRSGGAGCDLDAGNRQFSGAVT